MPKSFTAVIHKDKESGMYFGIFPSVHGAHTEAETIDELQVKLQEVLELCLEEMDAEEIELLPEFTGNIQIAVNI